MATRDRIRGITIEIDGNTTKLQDSLKAVNTKLKDTGTALGDVNNLLKLDPGNVDLLKQKQELLTTAIDKTKEKLEQEKEALKQAAEAAPNYHDWEAANKPIQESIEETREKLKKLKEQAEKTNEAMSTGAASQDQYDSIQTEIAETETRLKELREEQSRVRDEFGNPVSPEQFQNLQREISATEQELNRLSDQYRDFGSVAAQQIAAVGGQMREVGGKISDAGQALAPTSESAAGAIKFAVKAAADWETAFTGVKKTNEELVDSNGNVVISYDDLAQEIMQMSTETASTKEEIAAVMEAAGQLGVDTANLTEFTRTMIMLGDATNLTSDDAATMIAKFANVTNMPLGEVDKFGSALVSLGNNFATDERSIMEMATRLAGAGHQINLTEGEILGLATALSSVGIEAEMGGSAYSKAMVKMQVASETGYDKVNDLMQRVSETTGETFETFRDFQLYWKNMSGLDKMPIAEGLGMLTSEINVLVNSRAELEGFAEVSGMTAEQFVTSFQEDAVGALISFTDGLANTEGRGESTIQMLTDMGFTEVRLRDTLTRTANANELLTDAVKMGNEAFAENTALVEEAEKRYETTDAKITQTKESALNVAISLGDILLPVVKDILDQVKKGTEWLNGLDGGTKKNIVTIGLVVAAAAPLLIVIGNVISSIGTILTLAPMLLSPIGLIVAAIAGVIAILATLYINNKDFRDAVNKFWEDIGKTIKGIVDGVIKHFQGWVDFLGGIFSGDLDRAVKGIKNIVLGPLEAISAFVDGLHKAAQNTINVIKSLIGMKDKADGGGGGTFATGEQPKKFAAAYHTPYILTNPTIFGASGGRLLQGGDGNGAEVVAGMDLLGTMMKDSLREVLASAGAGAATPPVINLTVDVGGQFFDRRVIQATQSHNFRSGGH